MKDRHELGEPPSALTIDLAELEEARSDVRVVEVLRLAAADGASVEREGRQRW